MAALALRSGAACAAGVAVVAGAAAAVEESQPPFRATERFDATSYAGRYCAMLSRCDPSTLLADAAAIRAAQAELATDPGAWRARKLVESAVHPDTGEIVPRPFRTSGFVVYGTPCMIGLVMTQAPAGQVFFNWLNQSHNAAFNYMNRNATAPVSDTTIGVSYLAAVSCAMGTAYGLNVLIRRRVAPAAVPRALKFVAFPATVVANILNCGIMRQRELLDGIRVEDAQGRAVGGTSKAAAFKAVTETAASRVVLPMPILLIPAAVMSLPACAALPTAQALPLSAFITTLAFGLGLPGSIALFEQRSSIPVDRLEPEFQGLRDADGAPITTLYFNKGV